MQKLRLILLCSATFALAACSSLHTPSLKLPGVHRIDIQQGNVITQEMIDKLKPGMDKNQVRFALGTPPIVDVFHQERWDYVYSLQQGRRDREQRRIALFFDGDKLKRVEGDVAASAALANGPVQRASQDTAPVTITPGKQKKSLFGRVRGLFGPSKDEALPAKAEDSTAKDIIQANPATAEPNPPPTAQNPAASEQPAISP